MIATSIWIGMGGNVAGRWGAPRDTLARALTEMLASGLVVEALSSLYVTAPLGQSSQPVFVNAVVGVDCSMGPGELLRLLKRIERAAGRRPNGHWGPRPLDLDILDFRGRIVGRRPQGRQRGRLVLPHPELESRGFVLVPLAEAGGGWRHPRLGIGARDLLRRDPRLARGVHVCVDQWPRRPGA